MSSTGCDALELDPEREAERYISDVKDRLVEAVPPRLVSEVEKQIDIAKVSPGAEEAALFERFARVLEEVIQLRSPGIRYRSDRSDVAAARSAGIDDSVDEWPDSATPEGERDGTDVAQRRRGCGWFLPRSRSRSPGRGADRGCGKGMPCSSALSSVETGSCARARS